ncbi:MAG: DUF2059 domain-containing protein [Candidatus Thiodiazotropha taylori]|nr:DUF2059 domain-containing protein [Candidatus Thiodiazotropha taylori]
MVKYLICLLLLIPAATYADQRTEKIKTLMEAQGLLDMWQQQLDYGKVEGEKQARQMIDQMLSQLNPSEEFKERFEKAFINFISKLQDNWTAQEIVDVWAKYYGPHFSDEELDKLVSFYTSDIGKKDVMATKSTMTEFTAYFQKESKPIIDKATNEYIAELRLVAKECNCKKK